MNSRGGYSIYALLSAWRDKIRFVTSSITPRGCQTKLAWSRVPNRLREVCAQRALTLTTGCCGYMSLRRIKERLEKYLD